jgi:hypothetical protein
MNLKLKALAQVEKEIVKMFKDGLHIDKIVKLSGYSPTSAYTILRKHKNLKRMKRAQEAI